MSLAQQANVDLASALAEAEANYVANNPESRARFEAACEVMPGGNTRTSIFYSPFPLTLASGNGARVTDVDGHEYVDFLGEYTAGLYGHSNPRIRAAVDQALDAGIVLGGQNETEAKLAAAVVDRFPGIERVRFTNSGTESNLMAISTARAVTGRSKVMVMKGGYHGGVFYFAVPEMPINAPFPFLLGRYNDIDFCREMIAEHGDDLACVILEPMMGSGGCIPAAPEFLAMLRQETTRVGALLIFDEVMTSRLGPGGLQGRLGITPDLTSLGKYIGGGLTFGAFGGRADIMDRYDPRRADAIPHAGTFNNNVLTMSAGLTGLTEVYPKDEVADFNARGDKLRARLNGLATERGLAAQFTGIGSMMSIHFRHGRIAGPDDAQAGNQELRTLLHFDMFERGIYIARRGMFNMMLPMTDDDLETLVEALAEFFDSRAGLIGG
ncbi:MAG: aspartate aminotransferase family protein [Alphaproteobacteria bacterium]|jgi:glutamate-1-semialdehyde 2,1-aminomutase|nr:aspartate aminotransferase family protein [Alphaproteobacteria bacterium]